MIESIKIENGVVTLSGTHRDYTGCVPGFRREPREIKGPFTCCLSAVEIPVEYGGAALRMICNTEQGGRYQIFLYQHAGGHAPEVWDFLCTAKQTQMNRSTQSGNGGAR